MAVVVYGVMRARDCPGSMRVQTRNRTVAVSTVRCDGVCALVGSAPDGATRVRRDAVLAHSDVLHSAMERGPVLPLRFGVVMNDEESVRDDLLAPDAAALSGRLDALEGTAEFQLKGVFDSERVLAAILAGDQRLADSAALVKALPGAAGHFDRIRLGERIAERIEQRGAVVEAEVVRTLEPFALGVYFNVPLTLGSHR